MPRRHDHLFDEIASFPALLAAARRAVKGKRRKPGAAAFMAELETEVLRLERELRAGRWRPGGYVTIPVRDPKPRMVSAAPFRDRVVHHALCHVIAPLFERGFIFDSYANRCGKGTHRALARYERFRDRHRFVLRGDIFRYFPAIDHAILKADLRRRLACRRTLALCDLIIDGSNRQEPVELYFPGDDLFAPHERRRGLPIGNLTSQFFANVYLNPLDHFVKEVLRAPGYVRYVDDFALFHDEPSVLAEWRERIAAFLIGRRLVLHPRKTTIAAAVTAAPFLGFITMPGYRRLPADNVRRFRNRLRGLRDRERAGTIGAADVAARVDAWVAHAKHANTWRLRHAIFRGGPSDSAAASLFRDGPCGRKREPGRSPDRTRRPRRLLEQSTREPPLGQSQQERAGQPEQQHRLPGGQHACEPESGGSRTVGACG